MLGRKNGLTIQQHRELGEAFKRMRSELLEFGVLVSNAYPKGTAECASVLNVANALDRAKDKLDSAMFREHPNEGQPSIYYGPSDRKDGLP